MYGIVGMNDVEHQNREARLAQSNVMLARMFPEAGELKAGIIQLVTTSGAFYILDDNTVGSSRRVIASSNPKSRDYVQVAANKLLKFRKQGDGTEIRRIFDISEADLESALGLVIANRYPQLYTELIRGNTLVEGMDGDAMTDSKLLSDLGYTV